MKKKIVVGLSGGVDSSVAALILKKQGWDVHAVYLKMWTKDTRTPSCTEEQDRVDAAKIAAQLDIPFTVLDEERRYRKEILDYLFSEYERGRTPNPDSLCNERIKFPVLLEFVDDHGISHIATGHYAQADGRSLRKGVDLEKDQSYFLFGLKREWLKRIVFPVGHMKKKEVRAIAKQYGLVTSAKKDSQGLCFLGKIDMKQFLAQRIKPKKGKIITTDGTVIGEHDGAVFTTIGQRKGIDVSADEPYFVVDRDLETNTLIVSKGADNPRLFHRALEATITNRFVEDLPQRAFAKIRYRQPDQPCTVASHNGERIRVTFDEPQRAVTPGQNIVLYDHSGNVLGGGMIDSALSSQTRG